MRAGPRRLVRRQLDVEPELELDHADEVGNRLADGATQPLEELARLAKSRTARRG